MEEVFLKVLEPPSKPKRPPSEIQLLFVNSNLEDDASTDENSKEDNHQYESGESQDVESIYNEMTPKEEQSVSKYQRPPNKNGAPLLLQQLRALLMKRVICFRRAKFLTISQLLVPPILILISMLVDTKKETKKLPALILNFDKFDEIVVPYCVPSNWSSQTNDMKPLISNFVDHMKARKKTKVVEVDTGKTTCKEYMHQQAKEDGNKFNQQYVVAAEFSQSNNTIQLIAYFNNEAFHTPAIAQNVIANTLLRYTGANNKYKSIETTNHPLPATDFDKTEKVVDYFGTMLTTITAMVGVSFLTATVVVFVIKERESRAKHLQYLTGVLPILYWLAHFIWDIVSYILPSLLMIFVLVAFQSEAYVYEDRAGITFLLLLIYGLANIPQMYLLSRLFKLASTGFAYMTIVNLIPAAVFRITVSVLNQLVEGKREIADALEILCSVISPTYNFSVAFFHIKWNYVSQIYCNEVPSLKLYCDKKVDHPCCPDSCDKICLNQTPNYLRWKKSGIGRCLVILSIQCIVFTSIHLFMETSLYHHMVARIAPIILSIFRKKDDPVTSKNQEKEKEDDDVAAEREKVNSASVQDLKNENSLVMKELCKYYGPFLAVDHVTCRVPSGNCFGLLGVNGAGKTTIFKMLTGDLLVSSGEVYINGFDRLQQLREAQASMGYCPQFDALIEELTGRETLTLYCRLRGIQEEYIATEATHLMSLLDLEKYADLRCGRYSGGNKRKLSTAIALSGGSKLVLLDEPTTGMDPGARRHLWTALTEYRGQDNTFVLTSHSMEECEALCSFLAIMVNGRFQCLGTNQHIKTKYAEGYTVLVQLVYPSKEEGPKNVEKLFQFLNESGEKYDVKDQHEGHLHLFFLQSETLTWARVFGLMQSSRQAVDIIHYSVTQTSLEQVFLSFARKQKNLEDTT